MKKSCNEKKCKRCGWCCTHLGMEVGLSPEEEEKLRRVIFEKAGVIYLRDLRKFFLAMKEDEKLRMEARAKELGIKVEILPNKMVYDSRTGTVFVFDYYLNHEQCPFYIEGKESSCRIYEDRPVACRKFPNIDNSYSKEVADFLKKNSITFSASDYEIALDKCRDFIKKNSRKV